MKTLQECISALKAVTTDPDGNVVIEGSDGDREVVRDVIRFLEQQELDGHRIMRVGDAYAGVREAIGDKYTVWVCYFHDTQDDSYLCAAIGYDDRARFAPDGRHMGTHQFYLEPHRLLGI